MRVALMHVAAIQSTRYPQTDEVVETLMTPHTAEEATKAFEGQRDAARCGA